MTIRGLVTENLGYALLGGPVLAILSFVVGTQFLQTGPAIGIGALVYGLGWTLALRQSEREREREPSSVSDDERARRRKEAEAEKGGYGGSGGGG